MQANTEEKVGRRAPLGTILVADDKQENIRLLFETLQKAGYRILAATNGERAVRQAELAQPDLILMDVLMPGMDGFNACRRLKANPGTRAIPVIFMTALNETVDKLRGFSAGGVDYLTKPLQHEEVLARIDAHLGRHRLWRDIDTYSHILLNMGVAESLAAAWAELDPLMKMSGELAGLALWEAEPDGTGLRLACSTGFPKGGPATWRRVGGNAAAAARRDPLLGDAFTNQRQVAVPDPDTWMPYPGWAQRAGLCGYIASPVTCRDQNYGVLLAGLAHTVRTGFEAHCRWQNILAQSLGNVLFQTRSLSAIRELSEQLRCENEGLRAEIAEPEAPAGGFIGNGPAFRRVLSQAELVAPTEAAVLILGESGTGKELLAQHLHRLSPRAQAPLIRVNCAAIPAELFESEFFGHVKGAFTGAVKDRVGRFELADGGTLFLDEVGEIPMGLQGKLLRVLQEGTFERVGEERTRQTSVRIVAATNRDLHEAVRQGRFREDLFYRLSVFPLTLPPLRDRLEDLPALARHFSARTARKMGLPIPELSDQLLAPWLAYAWPGNIRELQNEVERAMILSRGRPSQLAPPGAQPTGACPARQAVVRVIPESEWQQLQRDNLLRALRISKGRVDGPGGAAEQLGLRPTTLRSRLKALGLGKTDGRGFPAP
ncbi:MAG: sigma 54-interacting transcriptional regulator [Candidatus Marinimicrobia bacterium]|nr:sigma 54-interacting transcriptional regulator [Candidatus Neomarinimicrobiota bacterium]